MQLMYCFLHIQLCIVRYSVCVCVHSPISSIIQHIHYANSVITYITHDRYFVPTVQWQSSSVHDTCAVGATKKFLFSFKRTIVNGVKCFHSILSRAVFIRMLIL